jgi:hypothetical protein
VNHQFDVGVVLAEQGFDGRPIPDIEVMMVVVGVIAQKGVTLPARGGIAAEEVAAEVVVDADYGVALAAEERGSRGAHQTGRPGDDGDRHDSRKRRHLTDSRNMPPGVYGANVLN